LRRCRIAPEVNEKGIQLIEQRLRFLQIECIEAFGEPAVDRSEKIAGFAPLALVAPKAGEARCGPELKRLRLLLPSGL
jgi:hypothetical protein